MTTQTLSSEISENIAELKELKEKDPTNHDLISAIQDMYDALHKAQGKEWEEQVLLYKQAKQALDTAKQAAQNAINDLSKVADTINKATAAAEKVTSALAEAL